VRIDEIRGNRSLRRGIALGIVAACTLIAVFAPVPSPHLRSVLRLHDFLHVPGFGLVAVALLFGFPGPDGASRARRHWRLLVVFAAAVADGALVELAQAAAGGVADPWDVVRDGAGAAAAVLAAASSWRGTGALVRWGLRAAALALVVAAFTPSARAIADEVRARRQFPVLADFSGPSELDRFDWSPWSTGVFLPPGGGGTRGALLLHLRPGPYPGLWLEFFPRDWRGRRDLSFDCTNPSATPLRVTVRIEDLEHTQEYDDRFNGKFLLVPGRNHVRIPLAEVRSAPRGRELHLAKVAGVGVFATDLAEPRDLIFHEFRLGA
jgi:hypothetical protein